MQRYEAIKSGFHYKNFVSRQWNTLTISRHMFVSIVLVVLRDYHSLQILIFYCFSILFQCMIFHGLPCESRIDNGFLIFNEVMANIYLYSLICITDFNESADLFDNIALCLMIILIVAFLLNLLYGILSFLVSLYTFSKRILLRMFCPPDLNNVTDNI